MFKLCLKLELLDEADNLLSEGVSQNGMKESYAWVADMFKRPHYIVLKHKIALKYTDHTADMVAAIQTLKPYEVIQGNSHGVKAILLILDFLVILQHRAPAFKLTSTLKDKFVEELSQYLNTDESIQFKMCSECRTLLLKVEEPALFCTKWTKHFSNQDKDIYSQTVPYHLMMTNTVKCLSNPMKEVF